MPFPLDFWDVSLWALMTTIILLATSLLLSPYCGRTGLFIDRRRLHLVAAFMVVFIVALIFLSTIGYRIYGIITKL